MRAHPTSYDFDEVEPDALLCLLSGARFLGNTRLLRITAKSQMVRVRR